MTYLLQNANLGMSSPKNSPIHSKISPLHCFINDGTRGFFDFLFGDLFLKGDYEEDLDFLKGDMPFNTGLVIGML
jgi:hypothetical protein